LTKAVETPPLLAAWCALCGVEHAPESDCPRQITATSVERPSWRVNVETPHGIRGYGVLVAECGRRWRARIVTFPNILWTIPGGGRSIKFLARSEAEAVRRAVEFVRRHCVEKGYVMRDELEFVEPSRSRSVVVANAPSALKAAPRYERRLPVKFGRNRPTFTGETGNLSESGLFVATETPPSRGEMLGLSLELEHCKVPLRGAVVWNRATPNPGRDRGMGLRLISPPPVYVRYVQALA
jgi:hypothetical protein